jgi:hypothetical protein
MRIRYDTTRWDHGPNDTDLWVIFKFPNGTGRTIAPRVIGTGIRMQGILKYHGSRLIVKNYLSGGQQTTEVLLGGRGVLLGYFNNVNSVGSELELEI